MHSAYVNLNNVPTRILTFGRWIEEDGQSVTQEDIIIILSGNPGVPTFYTEFMKELHSQTGYPVWIIGHAGHDVPPPNNMQTIPPLKGNEELFNLQGQVNHKAEFFDKYVPENARVHLIGHSIGAYLSLELLKNPSINNKITKCYLLFPTFEYMAESPNGRHFTTIYKFFIPLLIFLSAIFMILPSILQTFLLHIYMMIVSVSRYQLQSLIELINPECLRKVLSLASQEMDDIKERDNQVITANKSKIKFYYGVTDGWAPVSYYKKLKQDMPDVDAELCVLNYKHCFVLHTAQETGTMVASWIINRI